MICKMFTINGKAPVISNIALTGSVIADPNVIMEYSSMNLSNVPMYDGFSVRCPADPSITVDYSNMCYYSNTKYDNPSLSQLTKAEFIPISDLEFGTHYYQTTAQYPGSAHHEYNKLWFPRDDGFEHAGAYIIPTAAYHESPLYVYIWLPDVMTAPDHIEEVGLDCTTMQGSGGTCVNFYKCDIGSALNGHSFNQTYCEKIINFHAPSGIEYFATGSYIGNLNYVHLISASTLRQYNAGFPAVYSAYDSYLEGIESAFYMENCTAYNSNPSYFPTFLNSAKNCNLENIHYVSAKDCNIKISDQYYRVSDCSAYDCNVAINIGLFSDQANMYYENCNLGTLPVWTNPKLSAVSSNVTGVQSPNNDIEYGEYHPRIQGTYKKCFYHSTRDNTDWYMEDYPTQSATPL